ncbi:MAG: WhiB family transcriptional regulator [Pseudonocardiaceae bacterium]
MTREGSHRPARWELPVLPRAACAGTDPELWFDAARVDDAKKVCASCPEVWPCREYAATAKVRGVWGGLTDAERGVGQDERVCVRCGEVLPVTQFAVQRGGARNLWCRDCREPRKGRA